MIQAEKESIYSDEFYIFMKLAKSIDNQLRLKKEKEWQH
jgi:hypothetical protein